MTTALPIDHIVVNTRFETDRAASLFARLGFTLTPQGRHAMGSVNHLMVFGEDYLELIGLPTDGGPLRQELLGQPVGIDGLVYRPHSADDVHAKATAQGLPVQPVHAFTRPLELEGRQHAASFRTVRFPPDAFEAGRVYYCEHLTPELVWRPEWQRHPNGACGLRGLTVVSRHPSDDAQAYARAAFGAATREADGRWRIGSPSFAVELIEPATYAQRYGELACDARGRGSFFGAITLATRSPDALREHVARLGDDARHRIHPDGLAVSLPGFNVLLDFRHE